jgi:hypothetical protein
VSPIQQEVSDVGNERALMTDNMIVQHVGFQAKALVREYRFIVRRALNETSEFTLTIGNEAFGSRRVRFQDAPEICSLRLHCELAVFGNHPSRSHYCISETDLDDYRSSHAPKTWGTLTSHRFRGTSSLAADFASAVWFPFNS